MKIANWAAMSLLLLATACAQSDKPPGDTPTPDPTPVVWKPETPPAGKFCVENQSPWGVSIAGGIYKMKPIFQNDIGAATINSHGVDPVRQCFNRSDLSQPVSKAGQIIWLDFAWNGEMMVGETPAAMSVGWERVELCRDLDFNANGTVVLKYSGDANTAPKAQNGGRKPDASKFTCERYTHSGSLRTARFGPIPAKWEGRPKCSDQYPATSSLEAAKKKLASDKCFACPKGFKRSVLPIESKTACIKGGVAGIGADYEPATYVGKECGKADSGRFNFQNGVANQCYSCPNGYEKPNFLKQMDLKLNEKGHRGCYPKSYPWR